jgi:hypothetical protein
MAMPEDLFLDTSAHFNRHSLNDRSRAEVSALLASARLVGTSTFSKLEFKLSFLRDLAYLHGKLYQFRSIPRVLHHLATLPPPHHRRLQRALDHLARFFTFHGGDEAATVDAILLSIENGVANYWDTFDTSVDYVADGTGCVRSRDAPRLNRDRVEVTHKQCRPDLINCRIHRFFEENRQAFQGVAVAIASLPEERLTNELRTFQRLITEASADPTVLCDDRNCRRFGDAIIAADAGGFPVIVSSNQREFEVLCAALQKRLQLLMHS